MILGRKKILEHLETGLIKINPFDELNLGVNSYDVHLGDTLIKYDIPNEIHRSWDKQKGTFIRFFFDCALLNDYTEEKFDDIILEPNRLYLGVTKEYTETHNCVPFLEGKSSLGRLGLSIHVTAGKGDVGFCGHWTLEITCVHPIKIYAGMPIAQLIWHEVTDYERSYMNRESSHYKDSSECVPKPSAMYLNDFFKK